MKGHGSKPKVRSRKRQPNKCCVQRCYETKTTQNHLHTIPKDQRRKVAWEVALGMELKDYYRVCNNHFDVHDYIPSNGLGLRPNLKRTATPTPIIVESECVSGMADPAETQRRLEILSDFEQTTPDMKVLSEDMPALQEDVTNLLRSIASDDCRMHVESFIKTSSNKADASIWTGGFGPFNLFPAMKTKLLDILDIYVDKKSVPFGFKYGEVLPEVIIWSTMNEKKCTRKEAEIYFKDMCKKTEVQNL